MLTKEQWRAIEPRRRLVLSSIAYVLDHLEREFIRLYHLIQFHYIDYQGDAVLSCAWDIINWTERLRKLFGHGAGLKKKDKWYVSALLALKPAEELRHYIEHIDKSVEDSIKTGWPLIGVVNAYVSSPTIPNTYDIAIFGPSVHDAQNISAPSLYIQVQANFTPPVDGVKLSMGKHRVNMTGLYQQLKGIKKDFGHYLCETYR